MRTFAIALILLGSLTPLAPAAAQAIYRWTDAQGEEHFTDDPTTIPPEYRKVARTTRGADLPQLGAARPAARGAQLPDRLARPESSPGSADPEAEARRDAAREKAWREAFRLARAQVDDLEKAIAADRAALADPNSAGMPVNRRIDGALLPSPEYEALKGRIARGEGELAKAREALEDLDRRASREAVPQEWRR